MIKILVTIISYFFEIFKKMVWGLCRFYVFLLILFTVQTSVQSFNQSTSQVTIEQIRGGSKDSNSNSFISPVKIDRNKPRPSQQDSTRLDKVTPLHNRKPDLIIRRPLTGGPGNPGDPGNPGNPGDPPGGPNEDKNITPDQSGWLADPDYWTNYKSKDDKEETCSITNELQNKADINDLPDSCNGKYVYDISIKGARKTAKKIWVNKVFKKTAINMLQSIDEGAQITQENLEGFKSLKRYKKGKVRIIAVRGKKDQPEKIIAIITRDDLEDLLKVFKKKYN
jgi:hypothetical protein